ncbi:MAG: hypothetical protein LBS59_06990 [Puniceicoccales bacterium]|jgi:hypothetical protein|nr:hypothetical protein [Puniceicoccales bacterium]
MSIGLSEKMRGYRSTMSRFCDLKTKSKPKRPLTIFQKLYGVEEDHPWDFSKIIQGLAPFKTISLSYEIRESKDHGKTWNTCSRNKLCWDKEKERVYFGENVFAEKSIFSSSEHPVIIEAYGKETITDKSKVISISKAERKNLQGGITKTAIANISNRQENLWFDFWTNSLLNYASYFDDRPLFINGKLTLRAARIDRIDFKGKPAIRIRKLVLEDMKEFIKELPRVPENAKFLAEFKIENENDTRHIYIFDERTGLLLQKEYWYNGNLAKKVDVKGHWQNNGFSFPSDVTIHHNGKAYGDDLFQIQKRFIIDKNSLKINEPIDEKMFDPKYPGGCRVYNHIDGKQYFTPSLGNFEAEEQISRELDALFQKANEQK